MLTLSDLIYAPWFVLCFGGGAAKLAWDRRRAKRERRRPKVSDYVAGGVAIGFGVVGLLYVWLI